MDSEIPQAPKKSVGKPRTDPSELRTTRSIRLPESLWQRLAAHGQMTACVESAVRDWVAKQESKESV